MLSNITFCDENVLYLLSNIVASSHIQLLITWNVTSVTGELNVLCLYSYMWLLDSGVDGGPRVNLAVQ